MKDRRNRR